MGEGYPDMAGWGVAAIFTEAARLVRSYLRLLHPFIAAFLLPVALIVLLEMISMAPRDAPPRFAAFLHHHHHSHHRRHRDDHFGFNAFIASLKMQASEEHQTQPQPPPPLIQTLISLALIVTIWLLVSATAAIAKAVQAIYTTSYDEENPSTVKAIFKSLPAAFFRVFITSVWILLLDLILNAVVALPFYLLSLTNKFTIDPELLLIILQACLLLAVLVVDFLFILSLQVAVLESENYGLAAVKRAVKLVQVKPTTAVTMFVIYSAIGVLFSWIVQGVAVFLTNAKLYGSAVVVAGGYVAFATYWLVVTTVFYFASKRECGDDDARAGVPDCENRSGTL